MDGTLKSSRVSVSRRLPEVCQIRVKSNLTNVVSSITRMGYPVEEFAERAIGRAIRYMYANLGERITIDDMARSALFSKFYFTRLFYRATGLSPARFLSAVRLEQSKKLLLSTSWTVAEISQWVGYNSIGTFSYRFHYSVGLSPTDYRRRRGVATELPEDSGEHDPSVGAATVRGLLSAPWADRTAVMFVGLFPDRLSHGHPIRCTARTTSGAFILDGVPPGDWHLLAHAVLDGPDARHADTQQTFVAFNGPITVRAGTDSELDELRLRAMSIFDPPVLLARLDDRAVPSPAAAPETSRRLNAIA
jgi:AraC family transcriptional regulator